MVTRVKGKLLKDIDDKKRADLIMSRMKKTDGETLISLYLYK